MSRTSQLRAISRSGARVAAACALGLLATGCGNASGDTGTLSVVASFYPLQWLTQQIGGDAVTVTSLTKPGAEPHDLELVPSDVADISDADLVVYLSGFQPAVDDAIDQQEMGTALDVAPAARLDLTYAPIEEGALHKKEAGAVDPHFWLDPNRFADVATAVSKRLSELDKADSASFARNLSTLQLALASLDHDFQVGLANCQNTDLVTSHNAFGYLADRYGLTQVGITGLTADAEPSPADLAAMTDFVRAHSVRTIYYETLVSPAVAETLARETGVRTDVLDPIEGLTDASQGHDYLEVMRANLANLRAGQPCQ